MLKLYFVVEAPLDPNDPKIVAGPYFTYNDALFGPFMENARAENEVYLYDTRSVEISNVEWGQY